MHLYKKHGFTLAETIMTLFIVGVVIAAAIPSFTVKQNKQTSSDSPWVKVENTDPDTDTTDQILTTNSNILVEAENAEEWNIDEYKLKINDPDNIKSIYDIIDARTKEFVVNGYRFSLKNNNIDIGDNTIIDGSTANVIIGNSNNITNKDTKGTTIIGNGNVIGNSNYSTIIGSYNTGITGENIFITAGRNVTDLTNAILIGGDNINMNDLVLNINNGIVATKNASPPGFTVNFGSYDGANFSSGDLTIYSTNLRKITDPNTLTSLPPITSDKRLKNIQGRYKKGLNEILQINPVIFEYKYDKTKTKNVGVIAQEIQKIFPEAVITMSNGYLGVDSSPIFFASLNALKELNEQKNVEKIRNEKLQQELTTLEKELSKLNYTFWDKILIKLTDLFNGGNNA